MLYDSQGAAVEGHDRAAGTVADAGGDRLLRRQPEPGPEDPDGEHRQGQHQRNHDCDQDGGRVIVEVEQVEGIHEVVDDESLLAADDAEQHEQHEHEQPAVNRVRDKERDHETHE